MYFGIHDGLDLTDIPWKRGRGYDVEALSAAYTSSDAWARLVVQQVAQNAEPATMRCPGFCVSIDHARLIARRFPQQGIPSVAVRGDRHRERKSDGWGRSGSDAVCLRG